MTKQEKIEKLENQIHDEIRWWNQCEEHGHFRDADASLKIIKKLSEKLESLK